MVRRATTNRTNIPRIPRIPLHEAWVHFVCVKCSAHNMVRIGGALLTPTEAYDAQSWACSNCGFVHSKLSPIPQRGLRGKRLPFSHWSPVVTKAGSLSAQRFWKAFFTTSTETAESYWKQCGTCGRILPSRAFSRHSGWGPLEKQLECRDCKAVINTNLNPKRTKEQLHESSARRRTADLLLTGEHERLDLKDLFKRFGGKCFKTGKLLDFKNRKSWAVDHILPSKWLYPLTKGNAALLSKGANDNKNDRWPSEFYTNEELKRLSTITGANLELIAKKKPIINANIDVDACVTRMLTVRGATDLTKRIKELKKLLEDYSLISRLSAQNKKILGYS